MNCPTTYPNPANFITLNMSTKPSSIITASKIDELPNIPLSYSVANSQTSASQLIYTLFPEWAPARGGRGLKFVRFTDGITNTVGAIDSFLVHSFFAVLL